MNYQVILDWPNELWAEVFSYLNFSDLKYFRIVNQRWNAVITGMSSFKNRAKMLFNNKNISDIKEHLSQFHTLSIVRNLKVSCNYDKLMDLEYVLSCIGADVIECDLTYCQVESLDNLHLQLPNLQNLQIQNTFAYLPGFSKLKILCLHSSSNEQLIPLVKNPLPVLESLLMCNSYHDGYENETLICDILKAHASTLIHVSIMVYDEMILNRSFKRMWPPFPKLISISLVSFDKCLDNALSILNTMCIGSPLQKIKISINLNNLNLLHLLEMAALKWSETLQILCFQGLIAKYDGLKKLPHSLQHIEAYDDNIIETSRDCINFMSGMPVTNLVDERALLRAPLSFVNLVYLQLTECSFHVTDALLQSIFRYQTGLEALVVESGEEVTDMGFGKESYSMDRLRNLKQLELHWLTNITDEALEFKFGFPKLRFLRFSECRRISDAGFYSMIKVCPAIEDLEINECSLVKKDEIDNTMMCLAIEALPHLVSLKLTECYRITTDSLLKAIFRYQTDLETLILHGCNKVTNNGFTGDGEEPYSIKRLHRLKHLELFSFPNVTDEAFISNFKFRELRFLNLVQFRKITNAAFNSIVKQCPGIEDLNMRNCPLINKDEATAMSKNLLRLRWMVIR